MTEVEGEGAYKVPHHQGPLRKVRLFVKMVENDGHWMEQVNYQKTNDRTIINKALAKAIPYSQSILHGQRPEEPFGQKKEQIESQYKHYVPRNFVPDRFSELPETGASGSLKRKVAHMITLGVALPAGADESDDGRWHAAIHQDALMALLQPSIEAKVKKLKASEMRPIVADMAAQFPKLKENAVQRQIKSILGKQ